MLAFRSRVVLAAGLAGTTLAFGGTGAPAQTAPAPAPQKITPRGVGDVRIGVRYTTLRKTYLVKPIRAGCALSGPDARAAILHAPLKGIVNFTRSTPRRVTSISVRGGATARGVGVGSTRARLKRAFPKVVFDRGTEQMFGITIAKIPKSGGGRLQFAIDTKTRRVTEIGIPRVPFCE